MTAARPTSRDNLRRPAARLAAAVLLAVLGSAGWLLSGSASAQVAGYSRWSGGFDDSVVDGATLTGDAAVLSGSIVYDPTQPPGPGEPVVPGTEIEKLQLRLTRTGPDDVAACTDVIETQTPDSGETTAAFTFREAPPCNGVYDATVTAIAGPAGPEGDDTGTFALHQLRFSLAPPAASHLSASLGADRTVSLAWDAPAGAIPADFIGYVVQRASSASAPFATIASTAPSTRTYMDRSAPIQGGNIAYRVLSVRTGASGATSQVSSAAADSPSRSVSVPAQTTTTQPPVTVPPPAGHGPGTTVLPQTLPAAPTTSIISGDPGLPPGSTEPAVEDPVVPDDGLASGEFIQQFGGSNAGSGLLVPVAGALLLLIWACHFRFVTRQATRPSPTTGVRAAPVAPATSAAPARTAAPPTAPPRRRMQPIHAPRPGGM